MQTRQDKEHIDSIIQSANNIAVISGRNGTEGVAAAIAMAEYTSDKFSKNPVVIYPYEATDFNPELLMIRNVKNKLDPVILKVVIDYNGTNIESLDYAKAADSKLILEIKPVDRDFDMSRIKYDLEGTTYDLIIMIGAKSLLSLGDFYSANKKELDAASIINIDISKDNENYGKINIVSPASSNLSALVLSKFAEWEYTPGVMASKSLLLGLSG